MKFCDKVKKERRAKGLTQQQFADMLGVSLRTITNYEKGESYPKQREIYGKMAEILGVDINYLLTENEEFYINANEKYGATGAQTDRNLVALKVDILKKQGVKLRSQLHNNKFLAGD